MLKALRDRFPGDLQALVRQGEEAAQAALRRARTHGSAAAETAKVELKRVGQEPAVAELAKRGGELIKTVSEQVPPGASAAASTAVEGGRALLRIGKALITGKPPPDGGAG